MASCVAPSTEKSADANACQMPHLKVVLMVWRVSDASSLTPKVCTDFSVCFFIGGVCALSFGENIVDVVVKIGRVANFLWKGDSSRVASV